MFSLNSRFWATLVAAGAVFGAGGAVYAYATTAVLVTAGPLLLVAAGMFAGACLGMAAGSCGGYLSSRVVQYLAERGSRKLTNLGQNLLTVGLTALCATTGLMYSARTAYGISKESAVQKACAAHFNDAVAKKCEEMKLVVAPKGTAPSAPVTR